MECVKNLSFLYRYGRVNYVLAQRLELLDEVKRLQSSLGVSGDMSYTCETAGYFFLYQVSVYMMFMFCLNDVHVVFTASPSAVFRCFLKTLCAFDFLLQLNVHSVVRPFALVIQIELKVSF